ncbi:MAG: ATP synthase F0 subunit B [Oscillospiraceae bacterium]|nr:ATP synthase F0 subunit B [Oscillospiraceae bacterium]
MLSINPSELIWTVINFFLLYFLLKRFLFTPILRVMDERQAAMDEKHAAEQAALDRVRENDARLAEAKAETREEAKRILADADAEARRLRAESAAEDKAKAKQDLVDAEAALEDRKASSAAQLKAASPELAELLAGKLLEQ